MTCILIEVDLFRSIYWVLCLEDPPRRTPESHACLRTLERI
jgi:hypothetical protein